MIILIVTRRTKKEDHFNFKEENFINLSKIKMFVIHKI